MNSYVALHGLTKEKALIFATSLIYVQCMPHSRLTCCLISCCSLLIVSSSIVSSASFLFMCCWKSAISVIFYTMNPLLTPIKHCICSLILPGSWAGSEELVPVQVCSSHFPHLGYQLWPLSTNTAPHEYWDACEGHL